ncbi:MAG TPA: MFS transporter [Blastocatellia bacterium]|nr:MFS transporter [Blastocatellia bacterium]
MSREARQPEADAEEIEREHRAGRRGLLGPLAVRDFRLLWVGESISLIGDQFYIVALPWLTLQLTGSGLALGTVMMAAAVPRAVFMLVGGALSDRFSPRSLMLVSNLMRGLLATVITALILTGAIRLWHLYVLSVAFGVVDAFFYPAFRAIIPKVLDADDLQAGNSLTQGSLQLSLMVGPAPAGYIISSLGIAAAFGIDAATFAFSTLMLWLMRTGRRTGGAQSQDVTQPGPAGGIITLIGDGLRFSWKNPVIRAIILMIAAINFSFAGPFLVGLASLADKRFQAGPEAYGTMFSAWGAGALVGTLAAGFAGRMRRRGILFAGMTMGLGAGLVLLGVIQNLWSASVVIALMSFGTGFVNIGMLSWLQTSSEPAMLGRVMSLLMFAGVGISPLSFLVAGALVDLNIAIMFVSAGAILLLTAAISLFSEPLRTLD